MRAGEKPVDGALVWRSRTADEAIVTTIETLYVELLARLDSIHVAEFGWQYDLAFGGYRGLHKSKIPPYFALRQASQSHAAAYLFGLTSAADRGHTLTAVAATAGAEFDAGTPKALFEKILPERRRNRFLAAPDGQQLLVVMLPEEHLKSAIQVILDSHR